MGIKFLFYSNLQENGDLLLFFSKISMSVNHLTKSIFLFDLVQVELLDGHLPGLAEGEMPQQDVGPEGQGVHILRSRRIDLNIKYLCI